ncbi:MAG: hypothetical protein AB8G05_01750 [Oligoflexales bacterium]
MNHKFAIIVTHKPKVFRVLFILISTLILSCNPQSSSSNQQRDVRNTTGFGSDSDENTAATDDNENSGTSSAGGTRIYLSPFEARVAVAKEVTLGESFVVEDFKVPRLRFTYDKADFVQVLRCVASRKMETLTGEDVRHLAGRPGQQSALQWAWTTAVEDRRRCKFVGEKIVSPDFADLAAPKGEYYYVINPCVLSENSVLKKEACSFNLVLTYPVTVTNTFNDEVKTKNFELSKAEGSLNARLVAAQHLAKKIEIHLTACENMVAKDKALNDFKKGITQLGFMVVGAVIGGALLGPLSGPNGAVMLGQMFGTLGANYFYTSVLGLPSDVFNECIDPTVVETTEEQRKEAAEIDKRFNPNPAKTGEVAQANDRGQRGKYEEEYQVQALTKQLRDMLAEDGPIAKDTAWVQEVLDDLKLLDVQVINLDYKQVQATTGIDINDISTYPSGP